MTAFCLVLPPAKYQPEPRDIIQHAANDLTHSSLNEIRTYLPHRPSDSIHPRLSLTDIPHYAIGRLLGVQRQVLGHLGHVGGHERLRGVGYSDDGRVGDFLDFLATTSAHMRCVSG